MNKILSIATLFVLMVPKLGKAQPDIFDVYTSVGQMGLTVTNFGVLGNGWNIINGEILPSCQYKQYTENLHEQIEHFSYAGLWIGGVVNGERRVSTAIVDGVFESGDEGFEFFATSGIDTALTVSHQDFLIDFRDYGNDSEDNNGITNHNPLGIDIQLETYVWNYAPIDAFIILNYTITNHSDYDIENLYAGIWTDASVANMNYTDAYTPGGGFTWYDNLEGYDESIDESMFSRDIGYQYDADGDNGWAESYIGITLLGSSTPRPFIHSHYNQWTWTNSNNPNYPSYNMPLNDFERYEKLSSSVPQGTDSDLYNPDGYPSNTNSWLFLLSAGPFGSQIEPDSTWYLPPNESCNIVFAVVAGKWKGSGSDSPERRTHLIENADWVQKIFDGEDINRNNILDVDEDLNGDGELTRYLLPPKPPSNLIAIWNYPMVTLNWNSPSEQVIGYNVYKSQEAYSGAFNILNTILITDTLYIDDTVFTDSTTSYYVVSVNDIEWESAPSNVVKDFSSPPEISFQYHSNPQISDIQGDTSFTFPTRTFVWDLSDVDGVETITNVSYALDDTCETCWTHMDAAYSSVTLTEIETGFHTFYIKAVDDFGMSSEVIYFPDISNTSEPDYWKVMPIFGDVLLVDDFPQDSQNNAQAWYRSALDTILDEGNYSIWEIGERLPYSDTDITANLNYFKHVIWYAAYTGGYTYLHASSSILSYIMDGGNLFLYAKELDDSTFSFFPIDSSFVINPTGRLMTGRELHAQVVSDMIPDLDLEVSHLIAVRVKSFIPAVGDEPEYPYFEAQDIYHLQEPESGDTWTGTPNVCSVGKFIIAPGQESGKIALMTIPIHNGYNPVLEGNGSASKLIKFLLEEEFVLEEENPNQIIVENLNDWNLVGLPLEVENPHYLTIFPDAVENTLFSFDITYNLDSMFVNGEGYWLRFNDAGTTTITGAPLNELTITLVQDWNLISGIADTVSVYSIDDPDGIIVPSTLFGFNSTYEQTSTMYPGRGYWLRAFEAGQITIVYRSTAKIASHDYSLNANTISINGSELYFGVELSQRERLSYSLPPKPPSGAFDVRFKGDTRVIMEKAEIEVMSTTETLTIAYNVVIDAGEHMNWVLTSDNGKDYILEGSGEITVPSSETFILNRESVIPVTFALHQNYPNPFNPITTLRYDLPEDNFVILTVYNMLGRTVVQLVNTAQEAGFKSVQWDAIDSMGRPVSAGVYLYQIQAGEFVQTKKMVLLK